MLTETGKKASYLTHSFLELSRKLRHVGLEADPAEVDGKAAKALEKDAGLALDVLSE